MDSGNTIDHESPVVLDTKSHWNFVLICLLSIFILQVWGIIDYFNYRSLMEKAGTGDLSAMEKLGQMANGEDSKVIDMISILISILSVIAICMWIHRVQTNVFNRYGYNLAYSPGWAVGWFFIPVAHIWMPVKCMFQLFKASTSMASNKNPDEISSQKVPAALWIWGILYALQTAAIYVIIVVIGSMGDEMITDPDGTQLKMFRWTMDKVPFAICLTLISGISLILSGRQINSLQSKS